MKLAVWANWLFVAIENEMKIIGKDGTETAYCQTFV